MTAIIDTETSGVDPKTAELRYFGALDVSTGNSVQMDYKRNVEIKDYIKKHKVIAGFNIKNFDTPVLERFGIDFKYKVLVDLWEALAPRGIDSFGKNNKDRLKDINPSLRLKNYKLKTIVEALGLDKTGKGDIDYSIFQKTEWNEKETAEIEKYLKQDLVLTSKLFNWYESIFKPLEQYLPKDFVEKYKHLTCTSGTLAYIIVCYLAGIKPEWAETAKAKERIEGGHHIHPRHEKVRGNIICRDFISHYPTIIISYKLLEDKLTSALSKMLSERLEAKSKGDKVKATALKIPLNSVYGILGNPKFKNIYNPKAANECTRLGRELLRRYAKTLEVSGFTPLYGFTDSVYVGIPKSMTEEDLNIVTDYYINQTKKEMPNPIDSYGLGIDKRLKFMWFIDKKDNNYLMVTDKNKIEIKGGLFDVNCPKAVTKVFDEYISPKIIKELDVNFTEEELLKELKKVLEHQPELSATEFSVKEKSTYKLTTQQHYKISDRYGPGKHSLIPNTAGIGVDGATTYCTIDEFIDMGLTVNNIDIARMIRYLEPFYSTKEEVLEL